MVSTADDTGLTPLGSETHGYTGRYNAQVYERASDPTIWHLRLDDGNLFVGCDLRDVGGRQDPISIELVGRVREAWQRLERKLTDTRDMIPDEDNDPWADVFPAVEVAQMVSGFGGVVHVALSDGRVVFNVPAAARDRRPRPEPCRSYHNPEVRAVDVPAADLEAAARAVTRSVQSMAPAAEAFLRQVGIHLTAWQRQMVERMGAPLWDAVAQSSPPAERVEVAGYRPAADPNEPPTDTMERALWLRKRRNAGPGPNRLDGRRRRRR